VDRRAVVLALLLAAATAALLWPAGGFAFLNYDDNQYLTLNPRVTPGLTLDGAAWAFTSVGYAFNWHPLTWLSHMADVSLFGLDPRGHHLVNVLLHAANAALLFALLRALTGALWAPALVAALFAAHPLHVESVAWVSERKDLLSTLLGLATLAAYLRHLRRPGRWSLLPALAAFVLGLLAKPMLVGLPLLMLVLDFWPLGRLRGPRARRLLEKLPFLALAAAAAGVTYVAQLRGGALKGLQEVGLPVRAANALVAYVWYAAKALWPAGLTIFYPYPDPAGEGFWWRALAAALGLGLVTAAALRLARRAPYVLAGWLWYVATLLPVVGLVQAGLQAVADRYTYLPLAGLFLAAAWGGAAAAPRRRRAAALAPVACALALAAFAGAARAQLGVWRDSVALFEHALAVTQDNFVAELNLSAALREQGRVAEADRHFQNWARIRRAQGKGHP
jgi:hypothetical protein